MLKIPTTSVFGLISTPIVVYVTRWYNIGKLFARWLPTVCVPWWESLGWIINQKFLWSTPARGAGRVQSQTKSWMDNLSRLWADYRWPNGGGAEGEWATGEGEAITDGISKGEAPSKGWVSWAKKGGSRDVEISIEKSYSVGPRPRQNWLQRGLLQLIFLCLKGRAALIDKFHADERSSKYRMVQGLNIKFDDKVNKEKHVWCFERN